MLISKYKNYYLICIKFCKIKGNLDIKKTLRYNIYIYIISEWGDLLYG